MKSDITSVKGSEGIASSTYEESGLIKDEWDKPRFELHYDGLLTDEEGLTYMMVLRLEIRHHYHTGDQKAAAVIADGVAWDQLFGYCEEVREVEKLKLGDLRDPMRDTKHRAITVKLFLRKHQVRNPGIAGMKAELDFALQLVFRYLLQAYARAESDVLARIATTTS